MTTETKSGKKILEEFFKNVDQISEVDKDLALVFKTLYENNKLTDTNIKNELQKLRDKNENSKN